MEQIGVGNPIRLSVRRGDRTREVEVAIVDIGRS
jgi:hypothetical protein